MIYHPDLSQPHSRQEGRELKLLLEKLGEKLAYDRAFCRLYESFLKKRSTSFLRNIRVKGLELKTFERHVAMKAAHYEILQDAFLNLGGDPEAIVPSEDLSTIAKLGIVSIFVDPRANMRSILHSVRIVELTGKSTTLYLTRLAYAAGLDDLAMDLEQAVEENEESLSLFPGRPIRSQRQSFLALHPES